MIDGIKRENLIKLYKDGFPEDSDNYINYVYDNIYKNENVVCKKINNEITSATYIVPKKMKYFDRIISFPYFAAVSTKTEYRGKREIENVIKEAIKLLEVRKTPFVLLHPFSHVYYRKYGFTTIDKEPEISLEFIRGKYELTPTTNLNLIYEIFNTYSNLFDCSISRDYKTVNTLFNMYNVEDTKCYVLKDENKIAGYAFINGDSLEECVLLDYFNLESYGIKFKDNIMARLVDIPSALELIKIDINTDKQIILKVKDDFMGDKKYLISLKEGKICAKEIYQHYDLETFSTTIEELTRYIFCLNKEPKINFVDKF